MNGLLSSEIFEWEISYHGLSFAEVATMMSKVSLRSFSGYYGAGCFNHPWWRLQNFVYTVVKSFQKLSWKCVLGTLWDFEI